ncbi:MAG: bifunctional demethylmenaquinone methyltransferase/2-methoxy-6-polyprenyl-1,4-benzoquinol methylase UbiE [Thermoleophilia bacterium]|nr:bifunctional demethylmenaquinone methyltransferase/2-methoxy-6-polyprenyl-1,4-benzoquinol methylase UbiE [Thermoleophilia bacterium]
MPKAADVQNMFNRISRRYDLMNRVMTLGIDKRWRRAAIRAAKVDPSTRALDVCCGTGDITFLLAEAGAEQVIGLDFSEGMLEQAGRRQAGYRDQAAADRIQFLQGDALALPFDDDSFDVITVSFGVRNVEDLALAFREFARVGRPGARIVCLEITRPKSRIANFFYDIWFDRIVPLMGAIISRDRAAYTYLPESTKAFPRPPQLAEVIRAAGIREVSWKRYGAGIVALHRGELPIEPVQETTTAASTGTERAAGAADTVEA